MTVLSKLLSAMEKNEIGKGTDTERFVKASVERMGYCASDLDATDLVGLLSNVDWKKDLKAVKPEDRPEGFNLARMIQFIQAAEGVDAPGLDGYLATYDRCATVPAVSAAKDSSESVSWKATVKAINDVPAGRKLVTKIEAPLNVLYDVKEFMDALELMMHAVGIPLTVADFASNETGPNIDEWCNTTELLGAQLRVDAMFTSAVLHALKCEHGTMGGGEVEALLNPVLRQENIIGKGLQCIRLLAEEVAKPTCKARIRAVDRKNYSDHKGEAIPASASSEAGMSIMAELGRLSRKMDPRDQPSETVFCEDLIGLLQLNPHAHDMVEEKINLLNYEDCGETVTSDMVIRAAQAGLLAKIRIETRATRTLALQNSAFQSVAPQSSHAVHAAPPVGTNPSRPPNRIGWDRSAVGEACDICKSGHHGDCHLVARIGRRINGNEKKILHEAFMQAKGGAPNLPRRAKVDLGMQVAQEHGWTIREPKGGDYARMRVPGVRQSPTPPSKENSWFKNNEKGQTVADRGVAANATTNLVESAVTPDVTRSITATRATVRLHEDMNDKYNREVGDEK